MGNSKTKPEQTDPKEIETTNQQTPSAPLYPQLQIRNCIRNVRGNNNNFADMYPNEAGTSCGSYQLSLLLLLLLLFYFFFFSIFSIFANQICLHQFVLIV